MANFDQVIDPHYNDPSEVMKRKLQNLQAQIALDLKLAKEQAAKTPAQRLAEQAQKDDLRLQAAEAVANMTPEQKQTFARYHTLDKKQIAFLDKLFADRAAYEAKWINDHQSWMQKAVACCGRSLISFVDTIGSGINTIGELASKVPLIGPAFHAVFSLAAGPFMMTEGILKGERIDHAVLDEMHSAVSAIQEIAPYAQTVLSLMPGVGTGIAAAIGTSLALANGMPIDKAMIDGFAKALPGGAVGKGLLVVTVAAVSGDNVIMASSNAAIDALNLTPAAAKVLRTSLEVAYRAAKGENIPKAALEEAQKAMPSPELKMTFSAAVALGQGKKLQDVMVKGVTQMGPQAMGLIGDAGKKILNEVPAFESVYKTLKTTEQEGYRIAVGVMSHSGVNTQTLKLIRDKLTPEQLKGFDLAQAARIGAVLAKPVPKGATPEVAAGYITTTGMVGAPQSTKVAMLTTLVKHPEVKSGIVSAVKVVQENKKRSEIPWWVYSAGALAVGATVLHHIEKRS